MQSKHVGIDPTVSFDVLEAQDRQRLVREQVRPSLFAFFAVVAFVAVVEGLTRPSHRMALALVGTLYVLIAGACAWLLRLRPRWSVPIAVGGVSAVCAAMLSYSPLVHGSGELCVLAVGVLLGGFTVMFPLGVRNQLLASIVPVVGYITVLRLGTTTAYPVWYSASALVVFLFVFAVGARSIDRYRSRILRDGFQAAALAAENARLRDEARAADRAKSDMMAMLAHELRTPLGNVESFSAMILDDPDIAPDELRHLLLSIASQSRGALDLVHTLLEFGSIDAGRLRVVVTEFDVAALMDAVRVDLPAGWRRANVQTFWLGPPERLLMRTDRGKVEAIVRNLVHNALRHTTEGSVSVTATPEPGRAAVRFTVSDTGEGIPAEALPGIFERFARATSLGEGFGLGLFIVKRFVELLGGEVTVDSTPRVGTRFEAVIPVDAPAPQVQETRAA